jgi:hypothetical protein
MGDTRAVLMTSIEMWNYHFCRRLHLLSRSQSIILLHHRCSVMAGACYYGYC